MPPQLTVKTHNFVACQNSNDNRRKKKTYFCCFKLIYPKKNQNITSQLQQDRLGHIKMLIPIIYTPTQHNLYYVLDQINIALTKAEWECLCCGCSFKAYIHDTDRGQGLCRYIHTLPVGCK